MGWQAVHGSAKAGVLLSSALWWQHWQASRVRSKTGG